MGAFIIGLLVFILMIIALWRFKFKARYLPLISIAFMVLGIIFLCQPLVPFLYHYGLAVLMVGVFSYTLVSHFE
ncbi:MAG: hypothetical protein PHR39_08805 [Actinomycetota bacterium]|nr:hypothetical protein [Actinomycetota bacterium]